MRICKKIAVMMEMNAVNLVLRNQSLFNVGIFDKCPWLACYAVPSPKDLETWYPANYPLSPAKQGKLLQLHSAFKKKVLPAAAPKSNKTKWHGVWSLKDWIVGTGQPVPNDNFTHEQLEALMRMSRLAEKCRNRLPLFLTSGPPETTSTAAAGGAATPTAAEAPGTPPETGGAGVPQGGPGEYHTPDLSD